MKLSEKEADKAVENWHACNIVDLPKNFFGLPRKPTIKSRSNGDLYKVRDLYLDGENIQEILSKDSIAVNSNWDFKISFSLDEGDHLKVMPILRLFDDKGVCKLNLAFIDESNPYVKEKHSYKTGSAVSSTGSFQVPETYLDMVTRTWRNSKISSMEDAFTGRVRKDSTDSPELSKLLGYNFSKTLNANMHEMLVKYLSGTSDKFKLAFIGFHFGIDLNKVDVDNTFSYVTVAEFRLKYRTDGKTSATEAFADVHKDLLFDKLSVVNILDSGEEDETVQILYQYMQPCPPFGNCPR